MIVYGSSLSPFVRKTLAYAAEKGIEVENMPMPPNNADPAFRECSPFGKIPGFRDGDFVISDSTAIITYLEAKHPSPALIPAEPKSRARVVWYEEFADTILIAAMAKVFFQRFVGPTFFGQACDEEVVQKALTEELPPILDYLERTIPASGWLVDDRLTLADLAVATGFVNLAHIGVTVDKARHQKTAAYVEAILARPSFAPLIAQEKTFFAPPQAAAS
ncbi:MAG TPA: glutathione S-transferase family protein [Caulobacteraceae bacterium]|nr:glutathione S-transferase family protein [Caulobacteraceae bacterium]